MAILEKINEKINYLRKNSQDELNRINSILKIINSTIEALNDELKLKDYDFSIAINLVNSSSFGLVDYGKSIQEIKNLLVAKYDYGQEYLTIDDEHKRVVNGLIERLRHLKEELEKRYEEQSQVKIDEKDLDNLEDLKNLLEGKGRRKYFTYEMLESFFEVLDYDSFTYADMEDLVKELAVSKNIKGKIAEEEVDFDDVSSLLNEYLGKKLKPGFIQKYQHEICSRINIANAKNILEFFKKNNILDRFSLVAILPIIIYGRFEYIKDFYYERVLPKDDKIKELYFEDGMIGVWINEGNSKRRRNTNYRKSKEKTSGKTLYSSIPEVSDDDVWENVRLLSENENLLAQKYDLANIDYIWAITKPTWLIKKNIELFKLFNITDVTLTAITQSDLEDKLHFSVELGLLNTPRTYVFKKIEKTVPRYQEFMLNGQKKKHNSSSILNYFSRNTSEIGKTTYMEYMYWFYKMQRSSKEEFYQEFFSSIKAGQRNKKDFYTDVEEETISNSEELENLIDNTFVTNYFDTLIPGYDTYSNDIREYNASEKSDIVVPYYDESVLEDELVQNLEECVAMDIYSDGEVRNPYAYVFDQCIVSRYKVLRNLSILKQKYGYLNIEMVVTAAVYNSYVSRDDFHKIEKGIKRGAILR